MTELVKFATNAYVETTTSDAALCQTGRLMGSRGSSDGDGNLTILRLSLAISISIEPRFRKVF